MNKPAIITEVTRFSDTRYERYNNIPMKSLNQDNHLEQPQNAVPKMSERVTVAYIHPLFRTKSLINEILLRRGVDACIFHVNSIYSSVLDKRWVPIYMQQILLF